MDLDARIRNSRADLAISGEIRVIRGFFFYWYSVENEREGRAAKFSFSRDLRDRHGLDRCGTARARLQSDWF